ncbi:MAG: hypothetical protein M3Q86_06185 [Verrucomicrobiota bacterium]|nr:hypothetical protein [Verrucomicrobiota bacterium]
MTLSPLPRVALGAGLIALDVASCTELPNDIGVRRHRSEAAQTSQASRHPVFSSWYDDPPPRAKRKS